MRSVSTWTSLIAFTLVTSLSFADDDYIEQHFDINTELVYMKLSGGDGRKLVKNNKYNIAKGLYPKRDSSYTVKKLYDKSAYEPGGRVGFSYRPNTKSIYEARFMYIAPWSPNKEIHQKSALYFPFKLPGYGVDYIKASDARLHLHSQFYTLDCNYWRNSAKRFQDFIVISGVIGIRYFHYREKFRLAFQKENLWYNPTSHSHITTHNDMIGAQAGFDFQMNPYDKFSFDILGIGGIGMNRATNHVLMKDNNDSKVLRDYSKETLQSNLFCDVETKLSYQVTPVWNVNLGYQMFYTSGLALAPEQLSYSISEKKKYLNHTNDVIIYGGMLGFDFTF